MSSKNQKLIVEVVDARNLLPKDGHGTSSPYVTVDFYGQRKRTQTAIRDLNPIWNELLEFNVGKPSNVFNDILELDVCHDKTYGPTRRHVHLGRIRLSSAQFVRKGEEALIYYPLEKKYLLSWIQGEIGLKIYYQDEVIPPPPPPPSPPPEPPAEEAKASDESKETSPAEENPAKAEPSEAENSEKPPISEPVKEPPKEEPPAEAESTPPADTAPAPIQAEKQPESDPQPSPPEANGDSQGEPPVQSDGTDDIVLEPTANEWSSNTSSPEIKAASVSGSAPEVKVAENNAPQPIRRHASGPTPTNYRLDPKESISIERSSFDLVEKMHYLFVRVVKAKGLPTNGNPVVKIVTSGNRVLSKPARKTAFFEWDQTFAFGRDAPDSSSILEVSVWIPQTAWDTTGQSDLAAGAKFLGGICFDVTEIPLRDPPDSPLAPQWYMLEGGEGHHGRGDVMLGNLMLATWVGTQADESFPDAWKTDTAGNVNSRAKVYLSPKLWYLRATIIEAQDIIPLAQLKESSFQIKAQLGFQAQKTKPTVTRNGNPSWNEDLMFVAAEPFSDHLVFTLENRLAKGPVTLGIARIPLTAIERRVDDRKVAARWFSFEDPKSEKVAYKGRLQLKLCFDGGYHVMDEAANVCSDYRPTARQLWKPPVGTVELGIIGCKNLLPMKTIDGKNCTDSYCVAKYGSKWVRTRTVCDSLDPKWNEQYTWKIFDPCTVLTIGVFDSWAVFDSSSDGEKSSTRPDFRIGKIRIRISTLETGKVYKSSYPLNLLTTSGVKKMGELQIAIRFVRTTPTLDFLHVYSQPLMPLMHHIQPLGLVQQEILRSAAVKIVASHLSRSEPPLQREVVLYVLDANSHTFSMRKVRANWFRIINVIAGVLDIVRWIDDTRVWKNPTATLLVHALLVMLVWFPDLIVPTSAFYVFVIGAWNYRFRSKDLVPHFDPKISLADTVDREELDEEFDVIPSSRSPDTVRARYDKLRTIGVRVQNILGDFATQGERVQALVTWRDPRATGIFVGLCFVVALILYLVPSKMVAMASGFYYFRHPIFRDRMPSPALNFLRRLPSLSDRIM
ncbi:FT-interacting protein 7 [Mercurialis annua]|uniref:FT-interacting protein 7 n=1 Tax=Mercurialis annua TaxID=3986 RepID=UPI00215EB8DB|nr:FT-interacting protein 7 [Mercurialis annua]